MGKRTVGNVSYSEQLFQGPELPSYVNVMDIAGIWIVVLDITVRIPGTSLKKNWRQKSERKSKRNKRKKNREKKIQ